MFFIKKHKRRVKRLSLTIDRNGILKITAPTGLPQEKIDAFVKKNQEWISKQLLLHKKYIHLPKEIGTKSHFSVHKAAARKFIGERVVFWNNELGFPFSKLAIRNQVSRWGSCSKKGILNFNYKLLFIPRELADYVVVHELCHLKHFNHSKDFWKTVENILPDYKISFKELRRYRMN